MGLKTYLRLTAASIVAGPTLLMVSACASAQSPTERAVASAPYVQAPVSRTTRTDNAPELVLAQFEPASDSYAPARDGVSSFPDIAPETIAADSRTRIVDGVSVVEAPTFNPFEDSEGLAATAYLRSSRGELDRTGAPLPDGAVLDLSVVYAGASEDPYDVRGFEEAVFLSGDLVPSVRYDSRNLECSSRVTDVVYRDDYYSGVSHGLIAGLYMAYPRYRGHRYFGYHYTPYYPGGYYRFRDGRRYRHGRGPIGRAVRRDLRRHYRDRDHYRDGYRDGRRDGRHGGRHADGRRDDGVRGGGVRPRGPRTRDRDGFTEPSRPLTSRGTGLRHMDRLEGAPASDRTRRPAYAGPRGDRAQPDRARPARAANDRARDRAGARGEGARGPETRRAPAERGELTRVRPLRDGSRRTRDTRIKASDSRRIAPKRYEESSRRAEPRRQRSETRRATPQRVDRATDRAFSPKRAEPKRVAPKRPEPKRSAPKRAEPKRVEPKRSAPKRQSPRRMERPRKQLDYYPRTTRVDSYAETRCAKEESLGLFIPRERLDAARFDGLTVVLLSRSGEEIPVYVPPNYIEGFRLASGL